MNTSQKKRLIFLGIRERLMDFGRVMITEKELEGIIKESDYQGFYHKIMELVEDGFLKPVKASKTNGKYSPLYNKYRIIKPKVDYTDYFASIRQLHPDLNISGYLQKPALYLKHRDVVDGLSRYLWYSKELLDRPMSRKERSFSIWRWEKLIDKHFALIREVLRFNGLGEDFLNYYDTPEPFFEYMNSRQNQMNVLILENKDTWFTFRKLIQDTGKNVFAGTQVDVLIYGEGNKISKRGALEQYEAGMLRGKTGAKGCFLYFGDLDREGIRLFFQARKANPCLDIKPFARLYHLMLDLAEGVELPESPDKRTVEAPIAEFASLLDFADADLLTEILEKGCFIPQEIVNYQVLSGILC
ncbi:MAG: hypothetical protein PHX16_05325 [Syntrophaceticus sp.]|nr:hypothetical protein [Syntrophaceticus sp.]MDD3314810.1 hypothetical protein [Syntrophaceticus sp.]MDD4360023.1 hypothetical protein [Syntrophaceticus sp.]MDD4783041.1 hypothetical protein [Syntrophaceticus sp.]